MTKVCGEMNGALYIVMVTGVVGVIIVTLGTYAVLGIRDGFNRALRDLHEHDAGLTKRRKQPILPLFSSGDPDLSYEAERMFGTVPYDHEVDGL